MEVGHIRLSATYTYGERPLKLAEKAYYGCLKSYIVWSHVFKSSVKHMQLESHSNAITLSSSSSGPTITYYYYSRVVRF